MHGMSSHTPARTAATPEVYFAVALKMSGTELTRSTDLRGRPCAWCSSRSRRLHMTCRMALHVHQRHPRPLRAAASITVDARWANAVPPVFSACHGAPSVPPVFSACHVAPSEPYGAQPPSLDTHRLEHCSPLGRGPVDTARAKVLCVPRANSCALRAPGAYRV